MKYRNASEILPDELLKELQKYAPGEVLYVPSSGNRKKWGADSGARLFYEQRNEEIRHKYFHLKVSIDILCDEYSLSYETVRKIIYK
ncbi:MAG: CD3324 family protein [Oscillospiraceae bacterium]|nr:CD3324 family protein [Oscillospiraceae bacterium]